MERRCGTMPYIAPELLVRNEYYAEPADIWSCGIVLVAMLTGELPWDKPTPDQIEYMNWKDVKLDVNPWKKIDNLPLSLLRKVLNPHPSRRIKLDQIKNHVWMKKKFKDPVEGSGALNRSGSGFGLGLKKRMCSGSDLPGEEPIATGRQCYSQPLPNSNLSDGEASNPELESNMFHGFTQPAQLDNLYLSTQGPATQGSQTPFQKLVKRMTRFWVNTDKETTEKELKSKLHKLGYTSKMITPGILTVQIMHRRSMELVFKVIVC